MFCYNSKLFVFAFLAVVLSATLVMADNEGQEDLDKATEAKLSISTLNDMGEVIRLLESAKEKGLDESNTEFANKLLSSTLVLRATTVTSAIFKSSPPDQNWPKFRQFALSDLEKALKIDSKQPHALFLVAQLNLLPEGDQKRARDSLDQAVEYSGDDPQVRAKALILRAGMEEKLEKRLPDLNEAVSLAPNEADIVRSRGLVLADLQKYDEALADFDKAIQLDSDNAATYELKAIVLTRMKKYDEALATIDQAQKLVPKSISPWLQKMRIHSLQKNIDAAIEDLNQAAAVDLGNVSVILLRAELYLEKGDKKKALADAEEAVRLRPKYVVALRMLASILADMGKFDESMVQLEKVRQIDPNDPVSIMQIGMLFILQKRSDKAIEVYTEFLKDHPDVDGDKQAGAEGKAAAATNANVWANILRSRGDCYLNIGKQAEAIADYEKAYKKIPNDSGLLNNFAWVLATSPDDKLRDGKRAVEMASEACRLTDHKQAHILSTLAAAYAETGDFDSAIKWSEKSAEIGTDEHADNYKKEMESYKARKPFRELLSEKQPEKPEEKPSKPEDKPTVKVVEPFNGKNLSGWDLRQPRDRSKWTVGAAQVDPQNPAGLVLTFTGKAQAELVNLESHSVDISTAKKFGDCTIELEFMLPKGSNSGVYVMGEYEIQILDSFGKKDLTYGDLGAIYEASIPKLNAAKAPGEWQKLVVDFKAPRFENEKKTSNAKFVKVTLNEQVIHENIEMKGPTPGGLTSKEAAEGPLMFQGDHGPIAFRNIKITPAAQ